MIEKQYNQASAILKLVNHSLLILMMVLGAAILLIGYFWMLGPKIDSIALQKTQIISTEAKQSQNKIFVDSLKKLEIEYNQVLNQRVADLDKLNKMIPSDPQIAELFVLSEKLAAQNGFEVSSVDFSGEFDDSAAADKTSQDSQPLADNGLRQVIIHLVVQKIVSEDGSPLDGQTSYQSFKKYLEALETNLRLMDIKTVSFKALIEGDHGVFADAFNFDIITYYRQNE